MSNLLKIDSRPNISDELANTLRDMIFDGRLADGARINEVQLSAGLGVSRTPLREALTMLVAEETLVSIPRRGFFVRELTTREVEDIYPMRALLDPEALRLSGIPSNAQLKKLNALNERMLKAKKVKKRIELDDLWHLALVENCPNPVLLDLIKHFIRRTRRYEMAYFSEGQNVGTAYQEHNKIITMLKKGEIEKACRWLKQNMTSGKEPILEWLKKR